MGRRHVPLAPFVYSTDLPFLNVKNILGLDFKLPTIKVKEGKIIGYDPDSPTNDHFCLPQCDNYPLKEGEYLDFKGDEEIDYGPAKFVKGMQFATKMGPVPKTIRASAKTSLRI